MWTNSRRLRVLSLVAVCGLLGACATRPLALEPRVRPLDYAPPSRFEPLHLVSFTDETAEQSAGFGELEKIYRDPPAKVLNDVLLSSLRQSQGFEAVDRDQAPGRGGYVLRGRLLRLETEESAIKFGLVPSSMGIRGVCVTAVRLEDGQTGQVLLEETITSTGTGRTAVYGGGVGHTTMVDLRTGGVSHGFVQTPATYDSAPGYEASLSEALESNVAAITELLLKRLAAGDARLAAAR